LITAHSISQTQNTGTEIVCTYAPTTVGPHTLAFTASSGADAACTVKTSTTFTANTPVEVAIKSPTPSQSRTICAGIEPTAEVFTQTVDVKTTGTVASVTSSHNGCALETPVPSPGGYTFKCTGFAAGATEVTFSAKTNEAGERPSAGGGYKCSSN
jgi:hypothetical protein